MENMSDDLKNQYLTFKIDKETYAISVINIREVLEFHSINIIPKMPNYMRGIINLRGSVVPVIDLKDRFGLGRIDKSTDTSVIVTEIKMNDSEVILGLLADSVCEVIYLGEKDLETNSFISNTVNAEFIDAIGKINETFIIVLNLNRILSSDEITDISDKTSA